MLKTVLPFLFGSLSFCLISQNFLVLWSKLHFLISIMDFYCIVFHSVVIFRNIYVMLCQNCKYSKNLVKPLWTRQSNKDWIYPPNSNNNNNNQTRTHETTLFKTLDSGDEEQYLSQHMLFITKYHKIGGL